MQSRLVRGGVLGALTALLMGLLPALPASAALNGTASITTVRDLLAGRLHEMTFRVNNPSTATVPGVGETQLTMNFIQIVPASGFILGCPAATQGIWTCTVTQKGFLEFEVPAPSSDGLKPGTNQSFNILGSAPRPGNDQTRTWQVQMSADHGETGVTNDPSSAGALDTTVRVLQVTSVVIAAPAGAVDNTVTSGQNNTFVDVSVINAGSAAKDTTATLASPGGSGDNVRGTPPPAQSIPAYNGTSDGSATFRFGFNFGNAGTRQLTGDASATGADAFEGQSTNITVQTPVNLTYVVGTLSPVASRSGFERTFTLGLTKSGDPSASGLAGTLNFSRSDAARNFSATMTSPATYTEGQTNNVSHTFGPITIPGTAEAALTGDPLAPNNFDGDYSLSVTITGTDGNDAGVSLTKSISEVFTIDNLVPGVIPVLEAPNRVGTVGATRTANNADTTKQFVVKNGQTLTFKGDIYKAGTSGTLDTTAKVVKCEVRVFNEAGTQVQTFPIAPANCREDGLGHVTGSAAIANFGVPSGTALLYVEVADKVTENVGFGESLRIRVDNLVPTLHDPNRANSTGCRGLNAADCAGGDERTIQVFTSEPITGTFLPVEFRCTDAAGGNLVTSASFNGNATTYGDRIVLTLARAIDEDTEPDCVYDRPPTQAAPQDAPTNLLPSPDELDDIVDDIAPDLPDILTVNGNPPFADDGQFYTNDPTPEVALGGLRGGYTGIVARETNGTDGYQFGSDTELCRFEVISGNSGSCSTSGLGADSPRDPATGEPLGFDLYGASLDAGGNVSFDKDGVQGGNGSPFDVVLDRVSPAATTALVNAGARKVTVSFDEKLNGGVNAFRDWAIRLLAADGSPESIPPASITDDGFNKKVLNVAANAPNWTGSTVTAIVYIVEGNQARRFKDRAGNLLLDFPPGTQPTVS